MQNAATVLDVIGKRGARGLPLQRLYRQLFNWSALRFPDSRFS